MKAPRERTWRVLLDELEEHAGGYAVEGDPPPHGAGAERRWPTGQGAGPLVETVLSFEPPWRRACEVTGPGTGLDLCHGTFVLRDDGPECHLSWGVVYDPEPSPRGTEFIERSVSTIGGLLERVAVGAEESG